MNRREFIASVGSLTAAAALPSLLYTAAPQPFGIEASFDGVRWTPIDVADLIPRYIRADRASREGLGVSTGELSVTLDFSR